ncbi:MAG: hypothetical protein E7499_01700 [Ruminococcus sp.]|nr:hypothetical protein [Ruminococcus sp.]
MQETTENSNETTATTLSGNDENNVTATASATPAQQSANDNKTTDKVNQPDTSVETNEQLTVVTSQQPVQPPVEQQ